MNIHHKNMKQVSQDMQAWTESHLSSLGIFECSYFYLDIKNGERIPIPMNYKWYCEYMEKNLDLNVANRLRKSMKYWDYSNDFYKSYFNCNKDNLPKEFYKLDLVNKIDQGYEFISVGCSQQLSKSKLSLLYQAFKIISYEASMIRKKRRNIVVDLRPINELQQLHEQTIEQGVEYLPYMKSKFNDITLTAKEQLYVEYTMMNMSHKEIACRQQVSQTAVRKLFGNIKRKLGNESMSSSSMLMQLRDHGVLEVCAYRFNQKLKVI